jgi:hypothetical protein
VALVLLTKVLVEGVESLELTAGSALAVAVLVKLENLLLTSDMVVKVSPHQ